MENYTNEILLLKVKDFEEEIQNYICVIRFYLKHNRIENALSAMYDLILNVGLGDIFDDIREIIQNQIKE